MTKTFTNLQPKSRTRQGVVYQGKNYDGTFNADVVPGVSVRIYGTFTNRTKGPADFDKTFKVGDEAEHGSWNLIYSGKITKIGPSTVTIERSDIGNAPARMDLFEFARRNWDFTPERVAAHNKEESQYI